MTDTPIAPIWDAFVPNVTCAESYNNGVRACLAQIKPFLDAYHEWESQVEPNQSVIINRVLKTYQSHVKPLLKELEE